VCAVASAGPSTVHTLRATEIPTHWIAHGFDEDLNRAMKAAARASWTSVRACTA
jgi:hypothetical protein